MRLSGRRLVVSRWVVILVTVAMSLTVVPPAQADTTDVADAPSLAARQLPTVSMPIETVTSPGRGGQNGILTIRVGESAPVRVIVDTGFSGLLLFPGVWDRAPKGVTVSTARTAVPVPDGSSIPGFLGSATMTFSGVRTVYPVPFAYSNATSPYAEQWEDMGVYGLIGLGTKGGGGMINPLSALPFNLGLTWSLHFHRADGGKGALVLGAEAPTNPVMVFDLPPNGQTPEGALLWNDQAAPGCWTIGTLPEQCVKTWFDAAFNIMRVKGSAFRRVPQDAQGWVRTGTRISLAARGSAFVGHSFAAGSTPSRNLVKVKGSGDSLINTGNSFYFDYTLTYDVLTGRIHVSDPTRKAVS